jgi:hypothetical protein
VSEAIHGKVSDGATKIFRIPQLQQLFPATAVAVAVAVAPFGGGAISIERAQCFVVSQDKPKPAAGGTP